MRTRTFIHRARRATRRRMAIRTTAGAVLGVLLACGPTGHAAVAQSYPTRAVRIIVPVAAGSTIDLVPRLLTAAMSTALGQSVYVENRVGASGKIGTIAAIQSPPDGYTLATVTANTHGLLPALSTDVGYDPIKDLVPIVLLSATPVGFFVNSKVPVNSVAELADLIRIKPGEAELWVGGHRHRASRQRRDIPVGGRAAANRCGAHHISR